MTACCVFWFLGGGVDSFFKNAWRMAKAYFCLDKITHFSLPPSPPFLPPSLVLRQRPSDAALLTG